MGKTVPLHISELMIGEATGYKRFFSRSAEMSSLAHRHRSTISSSLFTNIPTPSRNIRAIWDDNRAGVVTKGPKGPKGEGENGNFQRFRDNHGEEIIVLKGSEYLTINLDNIRTTLHGLLPYCKTKVTNLPKEASDALSDIITVAQCIYETPPAYECLQEVILSVFHDCAQSSPEPGTVGCFLIGCFCSNDTDESMGCSPCCAGSFPPALGTPGFSFCPRPVILFDGETFRSLHDVADDRSMALVYVEVEDFKGFTSEQCSQLASHGVKKVKIVRTHKSPGENQDRREGTIQEQTDFINLTDLCLKGKNGRNGVNGVNGANELSSMIPTAVSSPGGSGGVLIIILLIALALVILFFAWKMTNKSA